MGTRREVIVHLAQRAEALGYSSFSVAEGWGHDAFALLAEIAVRTTTVRIGVNVVNVWGLFCSATERDGDFDGDVPDPEVVAEAWRSWEVEVRLAEQFLADAPSVDITVDDPSNQHGSGGGAISLRELLIGMIEEYARHMGHADLLRERIDGRIGQSSAVRTSDVVVPPRLCSPACHACRCSTVAR
ncbi:MAG: LLM class flavin-dependent oxidoreductase [Jatrophihabitans sp.]|uniref:LLM class flavin-dependent oxidoreductase n=1 Tax=Jatrophihabitans sp. TaxID=1932789 RepID=UPI003912C21D